ncbi:MAG TPA: hypothetical protein VKV79_03215 [Terriglobia bacterium]|nr:hypothetical protein [Terriglobia bacterium]
MQQVYERFSRSIRAAVTGIDLPDAFLAALTANESGGRPDAAFFEPGVYKHLKSVASGESAEFGSIASKTLISAFERNFADKDNKFQAWLTDLEADSETIRIITQAEDADLRSLATSWGLTQIMGYHVIGRKIEIRELLNPNVHYRLAVEILGDFAKRFGLKLNRDWEALFRCWNTGRPEGRTFDPEYVSKAMQRMKLYQQIGQAAVPKERTGDA